MKKLILGIVGGVIVLIILGMVVVFFSLNSIVKKGVETVGPKLTKVEMRLKSAKLSPFSGSGQLTGLFVGNPEGFKTPSAIEVGDVKVALKPSSVFGQTVVVEEVNVQAPTITLEESMSGSNLEKILANLSSSSGTNAPAAKKETGGTEKRFCVKEFVIKDGKVKFSATMLGGKVLPVNLPDIHLQNIGTPEKGVTAGELSTEVMKVVVASATKAAKEGVVNMKNVGTDQLQKAAGGLKGLFK